MCGFSHSIFVTTPVSLTFLFASYSVSNPWWARTEIAEEKNVILAIRTPSFVFIATPPECRSFISLRINSITRTRSRNVASREADLVVLQTDELHQVEVRAHELRCKFQMNRL